MAQSGRVNSIRLTLRVISHRSGVPIVALEFLFMSQLDCVESFLTLQVTDEDGTELMRTNGNDIPPTLTSNTNR